jgi:hypothetical protein
MPSALYNSPSFSALVLEQILQVIGVKGHDGKLSLFCSFHIGYHAMASMP